MIIILFFILGLLFGSFINVCIYRIPQGKSIILPSSYCPFCKKRIFWFDNIPVLSYLFLKGRCRFCKHLIPLLYPIVEFLTGILFVVIYLKFGLSLTTFTFLVFVVFGIIISFIDLKSQLIPDSLSLPLIIIGIILSPLNSFLNKPGIIFSLAGAIFGFIFLSIIAFLGKLIFKKEAMGGGDIKLISGIGAFIGPYGVISTIFIGSFLGTIYGIFLIIKRKTKSEPIAFGPFLFLGSLVYILFDYFFKNLI